MRTFAQALATHELIDRCGAIKHRFNVCRDGFAIVNKAGGAMSGVALRRVGSAEWMPLYDPSVAPVEPDAPDAPDAGEPDPPDGLGSDPALDRLAQSCFEGDFVACDDVYWQSEIDSGYEIYGETCGGRVDAAIPGQCEETYG